MGDGDLDFCTVSVPVEVSAFETAIHVALVRPERNRLRYHIAHGSRILYADGQRTAPFLAWQLASTDGAIVSDQLPASMRPLAPPAPTNSIVPVHLTQERFTVQNREVMVHRAGRHDALVSADPSFGPQQLLTRLVEVVHAPGSARLSFPALMPVTDPCRLHVVLHPRSLPTSDLASCLLDLRRVTQPPVAPWQVVELPSLCVLSDVQALLHACCPPDTEYSAVYINYRRLSFHPVGVHRHTVVTVLGMQPQEGLDTVYRDGTFGPLCFRGNDVAATRPGLARFLAYPANVSNPHFPTTSTTTAGCPTGPGSRECPQACPVASSIFTVFDTVHGVRTFTGDPDWSIAEVMHNAVRAAGLTFDAVPRRLQCELNCLPSPQILLSHPSTDPAARTIVLDLTPFGGDVVVRMVPRSWSVLDLVAAMNVEHLAVPPLERLQDATCVCLVNHVVADPRTALDHRCDLVQFYLLRVLASGPSSQLPPSLPVASTPGALDEPTQGQSPATPLAPSDGEHSFFRRTIPAAATTHPAVVRLPEGEGRYTVFGTIEGAINRWRAPSWDAARCRADAIASASQPGPHLTGRIVSHPLPVLFVPQIIVSRSDVSSGWHTIALDLRPIALGVKAIEVRLGSTLGTLFESGSILFEELDLLNRLQLPLRFRINSQPAARNVVFSADAETLTVEEDFRPVTPGHASMHPSLAAFGAAGGLPPWSVTPNASGSPRSWPESPPVLAGGTGAQLLPGESSVPASDTPQGHASADILARPLITADGTPNVSGGDAALARTVQHSCDNDVASYSTALAANDTGGTSFGTLEVSIQCSLAETSSTSTTTLTLAEGCFRTSTTTTSSAPAGASPGSCYPAAHFAHHPTHAVLLLAAPNSRPRALRLGCQEALHRALGTLLQTAYTADPNLMGRRLRFCPRTLTSAQHEPMILATFESDDAFEVQTWVDIRGPSPQFYTCGIWRGMTMRSSLSDWVCQPGMARHGESMSTVHFLTVGWTFTRDV